MLPCVDLKPILNEHIVSTLTMLTHTEYIEGGFFKVWLVAMGMIRPGWCIKLGWPKKRTRNAKIVCSDFALISTLYQKVVVFIRATYINFFNFVVQLIMFYVFMCYMARKRIFRQPPNRLPIDQGGLSYHHLQIEEEENSAPRSKGVVDTIQKLTNSSNYIWRIDILPQCHHLYSFHPHRAKENSWTSRTLQAHLMSPS